MKTQISGIIMKRLAMLLVPFLTVGALTVAARADDRTAKIEGKGTVTMEATADDTVYGVFKKGDLFADNHFEIKANVNADGSASGNATFVFGDEFSNAWLADAMTLECEIDTGSVGEDGTVVLQGFSFEQFHYGKSGSLIGAEVMDSENIRMREGCKDSHLSLKAAHRLSVFCKPLW